MKIFFLFLLLGLVSMQSRPGEEDEPKRPRRRNGKGTVSDWAYCSKDNPCGNGEGDCDTNDHCKQGLQCGLNNCRDLHSDAHRLADCCEPGAGPTLAPICRKPTGYQGQTAICISGRWIPFHNHPGDLFLDAFNNRSCKNLNGKAGQIAHCLGGVWRRSPNHASTKTAGPFGNLQSAIFRFSDRVVFGKFGVPSSITFYAGDIGGNKNVITAVRAMYGGVQGELHGAPTANYKTTNITSGNFLTGVDVCSQDRNGPDSLIFYVELFLNDQPQPKFPTENCVTNPSINDFPGYKLAYLTGSTTKGNKILGQLSFVFIRQ